MFSECYVVSVLQEIPINGGANSTNPPVRSYYTTQNFFPNIKPSNPIQATPLPEQQEQESPRRTNFTSNQIMELKKWFSGNKHIKGLQKKQLATSLNVTPYQPYTASGLSDHYFDIEKGVISNEEEIVYVYDRLIHIPVIYSISIRIEESVETIVSECDVVSVLQEIPINGGANSTNPPGRSYYTPQIFFPNIKPSNPIRRVISNEEGIVYVYDSLIHIPVIYSIPIRIEKSVETMFSECDVVSVFQKVMDNVVEKIHGKLPTMSPILDRKTPLETALSDGKVHVRHWTLASLRKKHMEAINRTKILSGLESVPRRQERLAPLIIYEITALGTLAGGITGNRADVASHSSRINALEENQNMLHDKAQKAVESMNVLIDNQENNFIAVSNMTENMNGI
ncbi:hypothetical protein JTB14_018660 [Gonioctena quinquepunctata]|nr:hypothetical protein JTB14_018660 [Gonioctena quinquepunctata]